jgi:hypothetical protein
MPYLNISRWAHLVSTTTPPLRLLCHVRLSLELFCTYVLHISVWLWNELG